MNSDATCLTAGGHFGRRIFCRASAYPRDLGKWEHYLRWEVQPKQHPHTLGDYPPKSASGTPVPFVNRPFESEIHGTVNFPQFCCVLLVTWCYRVLLSCYLRPK